MIDNCDSNVQRSSATDQLNRREIAKEVISFEEAIGKLSQRQFAKEHNIPRSSLQFWKSRKDSIDESPESVIFFESPFGVAFLHRVLTAAIFAFTKCGNASIHNVSEFIELAGLEKFIASSYSTCRRISNEMDEKIIEFGKKEVERLIPKMPFKQIALAADETFHPETCLVTMEPVSNYIMVEKYAADRATDTWNQAVNDALKPFPVKVIQVTSDEGRSLVSHATKGLGAHHSSDCFHVGYEISKGTSGPLASAVKKTQKEYDVADQRKKSEIKRKEKYDNQAVRPRGRRPDFEKKIEAASDKVNEAEVKLSEAAQNQEIVREANAEIGQVYHPYNLKTGEEQAAEKVEELLEDCFDRINNATEGLSDRCTKRVEKAYRVVKKFIGNITFFFHMIALYMDNMDLDEDEKKLMREQLIPGQYLLLAAGKEKDKEKKAQIMKKAQQLLDIGNNRDGPVLYTQERIIQLNKAANECAQIFQRSSSCVEGRNAQLSLRHHGMHRLSDSQLGAQTVIHNFWIKRSDDTTAARRLFDAAHKNLFTHLLEKMDYPARPRKPLSKAA